MSELRNAAYENKYRRTKIEKSKKKIIIAIVSVFVVLSIIVAAEASVAVVRFSVIGVLTVISLLFLRSTLLCQSMVSPDGGFITKVIITGCPKNMELHIAGLCIKPRI